MFSPIKLRRIIISKILLAVVQGRGHSHIMPWEFHPHSFWKALWQYIQEF